MANPNESKKAPPIVRPLIATGVLTEFGEAHIEEGVDGSFAGLADPTYVPGFSDLRFQRDQQLGEAAKGHRPSNRVMLLPVNMRWSRRTKTDGKPDETKVQKAKVNGYTPVLATDVGQPWLTAIPDGATVLPDGTIGKGDTVLMKCAPERAAQNAYRKQKLTMDRLGASIQKAEGVGMEATTVKSAPVDLGSQLRLPD